jgi:hypothetical protein
MAIWQFVADVSSATPTVVLDLNNGLPFWVGNDFNIDPAKFAKGYTTSSLMHGARPTNSVAGNRTIRLLLHIKTSVANTVQAIQDLGRVLAAPSYLKVQLANATPLFFRVYGDPDYAATIRSLLLQTTTVEVTLEASPWGIGPRVECSGSPFTVSNNPAVGGTKFDISGVLGDEETPLLLLATSTGASGAPSGLINKWSHFATRRRGTPSGYANEVQAEAMTSTSADTTATVDGAMSGGNKMRCTFATTAAMALRLTDTFPANGTPTVEARGLYRVYARVAKQTAGDVIDLQLKYGNSSSANIANDVQRLPAGLAGPYYVDLGKVPVPAFSDPYTSGLSGVLTKTVMAWVGLYAQRVSGSGALDIDFLYFMPCDEPTTLICRFPPTDTTYAIDGTTDAGGAVYGFSTALDEVLTVASPPQLIGGGGFPMLIPGVTNRIHFLRNIDPNGTVDAIGDTTTFRAYYWPQIREFVRP